MKPFTLSRIPEIIFGGGRIAEAGGKARKLAGADGPALVVADPALVEAGIAAQAVASLVAGGMVPAVYVVQSGEPKARDIDAAAAQAGSIGALCIVGIGGGSALDIAKMVACCAASKLPASVYELCATPLPANRLPIIAIPTTAGTGAEVTRVAVYSNAGGAKVWAWGKELKPDVAILDPELTAGVPPHIAAGSGLDALVHAIEAATNKYATAGNDLYCLKAIALISDNLERAVKFPDDVDARGAMLLGACYAGIGIDNCGTALAHNISHALADLAPIGHGRATGLAMLATIDWVAEGNPLAFGRVARAMGATSAVQGYARLARAIGLKISLDGEGLDLAAPQKLAVRMAAPANAPMRKSCMRYPSEDDLLMLAQRVYALA